MLVLEEIVFQNIFSFGDRPITIDLTKAALTRIFGQNGSGKSAAILDSVDFALYGKSYRDINKGALVNTVNGKGARVELKFSSRHKYRVVRGIKPNIFEIYKNGELVPLLPDVRQYQEYLETILGMSEKTFRQTCVIGASEYIPFMKLPALSRRQMIEELLDINIFSAMHDVTKTRLSALRDLIRDAEQAVKIHTEKLRLQSEYETRWRADVTSKIEHLQSRIRTVTHEKDAMEFERSKITTVDTAELEKRMADCRKQISAIQETTAVANTKQNELNRKLDFFENHKFCETCRQEITEQHAESILSEVRKKAETVNEYLQVLEKRMAKARQLEDDFNKQQQQVNRAVRANMDLSSRIKFAGKEIEQFQNEHDQLVENLKSPPKVSDSNLPVELEAFKTELSRLLDERLYCELSSALFKDNAIKAKIVKQYLPFMNKTINEYLTRFNLPVNFVLNENFEEEIKARYRDTLTYASFSEGEKKRIDLAILLTWREIAKMKNTLSCNFLVFDETADTNLDKAAVDELMNILRGYGKQYNIFIVSHKSEAFEDKVDRTIEFRKEGNFSQMREAA